MFPLLAWTVAPQFPRAGYALTALMNLPRAFFSAPHERTDGTRSPSLYTARTLLEQGRKKHILSRESIALKKKKKARSLSLVIRHQAHTMFIHLFIKKESTREALALISEHSFQ